MRDAHFQLACTPGDIQANTDAVICALTRADRDGVDIVSFPESFLDLHKTPFLSDTRARSVERGKALGGVVAEAQAAAASR